MSTPAEGIGAGIGSLSPAADAEKAVAVMSETAAAAAPTWRER
jgi:hypothetical protein